MTMKNALPLGVCRNGHKPIQRFKIDGVVACPLCSMDKQPRSGLVNDVTDPGHEAMANLAGVVPKKMEIKQRTVVVDDTHYQPVVRNNCVAFYIPKDLLPDLYIYLEKRRKKIKGIKQLKPIIDLMTEIDDYLGKVRKIQDELSEGVVETNTNPRPLETDVPKVELQPEEVKDLEEETQKIIQESKENGNSD